MAVRLPVIPVCILQSYAMFYLPHLPWPLSLTSLISLLKSSCLLHMHISGHSSRNDPNNLILQANVFILCTSRPYLEG